MYQGCAALADTAPAARPPRLDVQYTAAMEAPATRDSAGETLAVLYADESLVAVCKPAGTFVHRTRLDARVGDSALAQAREDAGGDYLYPVHRLDRGTSGLLLFATTPAVQRRLADDFAERRVEKTYLAVVRGWPPPRGIIDTPLARLTDDGDRRRDVEPQEATTRFTTLGHSELPVRVDRYPTSRYALVQAAPLTGRRHQVRRHLRKINHPLVGDTTYGNGRHNRHFRTAFGIHRLLLAAVALTITHPATGLPLVLEAPLATDFWSALVALDLTTAVPARWRPAADRL